MDFTTNLIKWLPPELTILVAVILLLFPLLKFFVDLRSRNQARNRELLLSFVANLEKYQKEKDNITAFMIEETAWSLYRNPLSISEVQFFLNQDGGAEKLHRYSLHKPYVEIKDGLISLNFRTGNPWKCLPITKEEFGGHAIGLLLILFGTLLLIIDFPEPIFWTYMKWLYVILSFGYGMYFLFQTDNKRDARKYVLSQKDN